MAGDGSRTRHLLTVAYAPSAANWMRRPTTDLEDGGRRLIEVPQQLPVQDERADPAL